MWMRSLVVALWLGALGGEARGAGLRSMEMQFERPGMLGPEIRSMLDEPRLPEWTARVSQYRHLEREAQLHKVQAYVNGARAAPAHPYRPVPPAAMMRSGGDCKGYALAKMAMLRDLGWREQDMRLVVVALPFHAEAHAILLVRHGGHHYVLDNMADHVTVDRYPFDEFTAVVGPFRWPRAAAIIP